MSTYRAPLRDMQFVLRELAGVEEVAKLPGCEDTTDVLDSILEEAASFASGVLDPLNRIADKEGCTWNDGEVTTPKGFKEAYKKFADAGWIGLPVPAEYGGQGLPQLLLGPTLEMWNASNIGFANGPLLNQGAIEAIELAARAEQKTDVHSESRFRQVDRHDVSYRAASRFGSRAGSHQSRARGRPLPVLPGRRSSSRSASTTWPRTSFTWCSRVCPMRPKARRASRSSSCRRSSSTTTARWASATTSSAPASSTSSASTATRRAR